MKILVLLAYLFSGVLFAEQIGYSQAPRGAEGKFKIDLFNDYVKKMRIGMDFAVVLQNLDHGNAATNLSGLNVGFQNATGNLNLDTELTDGITTYIELYLSSEHHTEMYMKEGYLLIENLKMLNSTFLNNLMSFTKIKAGQMEINFGDWHLRRSDNAHVNNNPLIGNVIIDTNTTETGLELMFDFSNIELLLGVSNGSIKEDLYPESGIASYTKLAFDKSFNDMRFRLSGSYYQVDHAKNPSTQSKTTLYSGNRSGARYQNLMGATADAGQVKPSISQDVEAYIFNLMWQYKRFEIFAHYETAKDKNSDGSTTISTLEEQWDQYFLDLVYHLNDSFYLAGRYNVAEHKKSSGASSTEEVNRTQFGFGYNLTDTVLIKGEWVKQKYKNFTSSSLAGGKFDGWLIEGSVHF